jgi:hypothetical protein
MPARVTISPPVLACHSHGTSSNRSSEFDRADSAWDGGKQKPALRREAKPWRSLTTHTPGLHRFASRGHVTQGGFISRFYAALRRNAFVLLDTVVSGELQQIRKT